MDLNRESLHVIRDRIEQEHREAVNALKVLERYLEKTPVIIGKSDNGQAVTGRGIVPGSQREKIAAVIAEFKSVPDIARDTGLAESAVRGCLYAKDFRKKVEKKRINKKLHFRMRGESA
jgi:hypothetical protein